MNDDEDDLPSKVARSFPPIQTIATIGSFLALDDGCDVLAADGVLDRCLGCFDVEAVAREASRSHSMSRKKPLPVRSAKTLRVPFTDFNAVSTCAPISSILARSLPEIFSPSGVRIPVLSISLRPLIGRVQPLARPGFEARRSSGR